MLDEFRLARKNSLSLKQSFTHLTSVILNISLTFLLKKPKTTLGPVARIYRSNFWLACKPSLWVRTTVFLSVETIDYVEVEKNISDESIKQKVADYATAYEQNAKPNVGMGGIADLVDFTRVC